jgi:hypothetical protein
MNRIFWSCMKVLTIIFSSFFFSACASHSFKAASNLDVSDKKFESDHCQKTLKVADRHQNMKLLRVVLSPIAVLGTGGLLTLPVLAANSVAEVTDNFHSASVLESCSNSKKSNETILADSATNIGINFLSGGIGIKGINLPTIGAGGK